MPLITNAINSKTVWLSCRSSAAGSNEENDEEYVVVNESDGVESGRSDEFDDVISVNDAVLSYHAKWMTNERNDNTHKFEAGDGLPGIPRRRCRAAGRHR